MLSLNDSPLSKIALGASVWLLAACGPSTPPPKGPNNPPPAKNGGNTATSINQAGKNMAPPPVKRVERKVSKNAEADFKKALKRYKQQSKGGVTADNCEDLASIFEDVYKDHPKIVEAKYSQGVIYAKCGKDGKAEAAFNALLSKHPKHGGAMNSLGVLALKRGQKDRARELFRKASVHKSSEGYVNLAILARNEAVHGDKSVLKGAVNNIFRALAVDSFNIDAYGTLGTIVYDHARSKAQLNVARLICLQATKQDPKFPPVYNVLGLILLRMNEVTRALKQFRKAVALSPNYIDAHMNIGAITLNFRDYKTAEASFNKVLSLNPSKKIWLDATIGLGVAKRGQRKFDEAMRLYKEAKKMAPGNASIDYNMGILVQDYLFEPANPAQAISQLEVARKYLQAFADAGKGSRKHKRDVKRRLKNIREMVPMLREQQKLMKQMQNQKEADAKKPAKPAAKK